MTWLSDRSGIASIGVVTSAQYPQAPTSTKNAITRKRFLSDSSMSQLITHAPPVSRTRTQTGAHGDRHPTVTAKRTSGRYAGRSADFGGGVRGGGLVRAGWCGGPGAGEGRWGRGRLLMT